MSGTMQGYRAIAIANILTGILLLPLSVIFGFFLAPLFLFTDVWIAAMGGGLLCAYGMLSLAYGILIVLLSAVSLAVVRPGKRTE